MEEDTGRQYETSIREKHLQREQGFWVMDIFFLESSIM